MSVFKKAAAIEPKKPVKKTSNKEEVTMPGLRHFAELDALIKALAAIQSTLDTSLKGVALDHFVATANGRKPESFRGLDDGASASFELRKRSSRSILSEAELEQLERLGIKPEKSTTVPKMFGINPKYSADETLLDKVSSAIEKIVPEDFIVVQEEKSNFIVGESTMEDAFRKGATAETVLLVGTLAIKPKLDETDLGKIIDSVRGLVAPATDVME